MKPGRLILKKDSDCKQKAKLSILETYRDIVMLPHVKTSALCRRHIRLQVFFSLKKSDFTAVKTMPSDFCTAIYLVIKSKGVICVGHLPPCPRYSLHQHSEWKTEPFGQELAALDITKKHGTTWQWIFHSVEVCSHSPSLQPKNFTESQLKCQRIKSSQWNANGSTPKQKKLPLESSHRCSMLI